jgi:hypothetical protein
MTDATAASIAFIGLVAALFGAFSDEFYPSMLGAGKKQVPK